MSNFSSFLSHFQSHDFFRFRNFATMTTGRGDFSIFEFIIEENWGEQKLQPLPLTGHNLSAICISVLWFSNMAITRTKTPAMQSIGLLPTSTLYILQFAIFVIVHLSNMCWKIFLAVFIRQERQIFGRSAMTQSLKTKWKIIHGNGSSIKLLFAFVVSQVLPPCF